MFNTHTNRWLCLLTSLVLVGGCLAATFPNPGVLARLKGASAASGCPSGLLVSLKLDNNITDSEGGNTFTAPSNPANFTNGIVNQGFWGNAGYDSHITANDDPDFSMGTATKSWSWWFYSTSSANDFITMFAKGDTGGGNEEYFVYIDNTDKLKFFVYDSMGADYSVTSTGSISVDTWYHVVVTYDSTNLKMYINNGSPDSVAGTSSRNTASVFLFGKSLTAGTMFTGIIDEFQIYSSALTAGDVATLYASGGGKQCP